MTIIQRTARKNLPCGICGEMIAAGAQYYEVNFYRRQHSGCEQQPKPTPRYVRVATRADGSRLECALYRAWSNMRRRCASDLPAYFKWYKAKGITVCDEWNDYDTFRRWALANGFRKGLTLDRYPNANGNYQPGNCRWATRQEQIYNASCTDVISFNGETLPSPVWAKRLGLHPEVLRGRINNGWSIEHALTVPKGHLRPGQRRGRVPKSVPGEGYSNDGLPNTGSTHRE